MQRYGKELLPCKETALSDFYRHIGPTDKGRVHNFIHPRILTIKFDFINTRVIALLTGDIWSLQPKTDELLNDAYAQHQCRTTSRFNFM